MDLKTGLPYWLIKNGLPYHYPKLSQDLKTDVVVIGAGISGALTAHRLVSSGVSCVMLDRRTIGLGSTCASTSLVQYELDKSLLELSDLLGERTATLVYLDAVEAVGRLNALCEETGLEEVKQCPSVYYADRVSKLGFLRKEYTLRKKAGIDVQLLERDELKQRYGFIAPAAIESSVGLSVDAYSLCHALCRSAVAKGLEIYDRTEVLAVEGKRSFKVITEPGFTISCNYIVNAGGYETGNEMKDIVRLCSTYAIASEHFDDASELWPNKAMLWNTADPYLYMRQTSDNRIIVGGRDESLYHPAKRDELIRKKSRQLEHDFQKLFPETDFRTEFSWAGTFGVTKDSLPYIGALKGKPNTYYALGYGGNGILFSMIASEIITDAITGKVNTSADLYSFYR